MIYLFNNNEEMIRIIPNSAIKRMYQTQALTDDNYISDRLDVEIQALNDEELSELEYMAVDDIENPQRFHYYFVVKETTERQITSLTGVQSGIEELRKTPVYDMRPANRSPKFIADRLLEGTNWQAGYTTDDVGTISTNFYYTDVFSALKKMCVAFGIEMQFFVEITTNRIGARYIEFRKRTGKSVGKRVVYGHNALKIVKEVEKTNTVTALIGRGKGVQVSESDEGNIGYGRKIGFESVEWKKSSGAPVDKPLGQEFVEIPELTLQYGIKNSNGTVRPKIGFIEFQDEESETRLIDRTYNALLELSRPQVLLETSSVYLPDTGIGDTINVVRHDRDLRYQTRVFEITWDRLANQAVDMKLGDRLGESENKRINRISNQVSGNISTELSSTIEELVDRLTSADGKNTNWYTAYDPMTNPETMGLVRVNDNWYQPDPEYEGEFILKQWNGEMWVEILRTTGNPELVRQLEGAMAEAEEAKQAAQKAFTDAIAEAERLVTETDTIWQGKMDDYDEQVSQIETDAQSAQDKADQALQEVGISTDLAQTAKDLADTAKDNAQTALDNASQAIINAGDALSQAQALDGQFSDLSLTVDDLNAEVDLRLTRAEVDSLVDGKGLANFTYVDNQIDATAENFGLEMTRVEGKIPISVQEENLVIKGDGYHYTNEYLVTRYDLTRDLVVGNTYTIVLKGGIGSDGVTQKFSLFTDNGSNEVGDLVHTTVGIYRLTFKLAQTGADSGDKKHIMIYNRPNNESYARIEWLKLIEGDVTDNNFTPSRADLITQYGFNVFETDFNVKAEGWDATSSYVSNNQTKINSLISNADGWQSTISYVDNNQTKINQTIARVNSYEQTIGANGENIAQMVMTDSLFSTKVLASVEIGGRNYAVGTTDKMQYNQQILEWSGNMQANTSKNVYTLADLGAKVGDTYTASIYIAQSGGFGSGLRIDTQSVAEKYVTPKTMHDFASVTFTVEEGDSEYRFFYANTSGFNALYSIEACKFQIEKGNKRTDWNPSPLDKADQSQVSQLAGSWALTLKSRGELKTQINATTDGIRLASKLIHLSGTSLIDDAVIKSAHIEELNANKIVGNTADFTTMVTKGLTADVIKSEHINATEGLVNRIFSDAAYIKALTTKTTFVEQIKAVEIDAVKITTGTLNAANVNIINLDVNNLTGNKTNFVQTAWNGISTAVKVNSTGIDLLYANGIVSTKLNAGGLLFYEGGVQVALLQGMAESGNPYGYALAARTNYRVALAYQATSTSYKSAISVRSTGAIQIGHDSASPSDVTWLTTNRILLNGSSTHAVKYTTINVFGEVCVFICNAAGNAGVAFGASELYLIRNNQATQFSSMLG